MLTGRRFDLRESQTVRPIRRFSKISAGIRGRPRGAGKPRRRLFVCAVRRKKCIRRAFAPRLSWKDLGDRLEGRSRPGHFQRRHHRVLKLFEIVQPRFVFFGRKDAQQVRIIRQMAGDLDLYTGNCDCPIVREPDGLALSSR